MKGKKGKGMPYRNPSKTRGLKGNGTHQKGGGSSGRHKGGSKK